MQPVSKSELMSQVEQLTIERDGWKDAALQSMAAEVLLTDAVNTHRSSAQVDGWGHYKPDADLKLWNVLDKVEAHNAGCICEQEASNGRATQMVSRRFRAVPSFGGSN